MRPALASPESALRHQLLTVAGGRALGYVTLPPQVQPQLSWMELDEEWPMSKRGGWR